MARRKKNNSFIGLVLAGGASSRMGTDKSLLEIDGESLLDRSCRILSEAGAKQVLVSRNEFRHGCLPDVYPNLGPLSGIHSVLFHSDLPVVAVPVDMPLLTANCLKLLVSAGLLMETSVHYVDNYLPAYIHNTAHSRKYLESLLSDLDGKGREQAKQSQLSVRRFMVNTGSAQLKAENEGELMNVNTPDDWQHGQTLSRILNLSSLRK